MQTLLKVWKVEQKLLSIYLFYEILRSKVKKIVVILIAHQKGMFAYFIF